MSTNPAPDLKHSTAWLLVLLILCAGNYALFRAAWAIDYFDWYRHAGPIIGLTTAIFAAAWGGMDRNTGLVAADPRQYCGACLQVAGLPILVFGGHLRHTPGAPLLDRLFALPLILIFTLGGGVWLLCIAPLQYFVFLVCGAPSRLALRSSYRVNAVMDGPRLVYLEQQVAEKAPAGFWDASLRDKPVVLASAFSAVLFMLLALLH
ncbi:hypothetical protein VVD49_03830 [Uliginosibacterium sp. H3]|uniref:Uncharacterized protein n=1 Tax=Uliginosibacterium silvisoli TaxID=3114758 RepID=A0ABU6JZQ2_9RHOO|nr:hypothetical protein [Uliginosibacterium sp. H3]